MRAAVLLLVAAVVALAAAGSPFITVGDHFQFVAPDGRTRIFHGVNVVYKIFPYYPSQGAFDPVTSFNDQDIDNIVNWGFTFVRLGVLWAGVEPAPAQYNQTYLGELRSIVDKLYARGIYTLLDNHQDVLSPKYCGEGVADHLVHPNKYQGTFPFPVTNKPAIDPTTGYPLLADCLKINFADYYFAVEVGEAFQAFYDNTDSLGDKFAAFWQNVTGAFSDHPGVIGFELWNEPWNGDVVANPLLLEPGHADAKNLAPLWEKLHTAIRQVDTEHLVFYENVQSDAFFQSGFTQAPGGAAWANKTVFSYHVYCPDQNGHGDPANPDVCFAFDSAKIVESVHDAQRLKGGMFLTEFGAVAGDAAGVDEISRVTNIADSNLQSWSYWQYKYFNDVTTQSSVESLFLANGTVDAGKIQALTRTYALAVQGKPTRMNFEPTSASFDFSFNLDKSVSNNTEIYASTQYWYPKGVNIEIFPAGAATANYVPANNRIWIVPAANTPTNQTIRVVVTKKY
ncbi:endoglycoceramidase [Capsaspora owczarzaki ATCC 30864]|uniref:Endoglycoceramidase n=1 Tax=Capsaspora owczarzaki (strain ATCC 30864) TaxID=595528 RepID=A0A0D2WIP1_CAPO3|nr:endoglycoceramidase [Capsaspora owczarzaki ATCC 30864]KJE88963.1 endoglycoceramidase [Capsaspora owczarzaki ATCC 30864]|eukprot:XP_004365401.1 endoglycoceramidase [Capsaspora owczarzaki ATCC 30864]